MLPMIANRGPESMTYEVIGAAPKLHAEACGGRPVCMRRLVAVKPVCLTDPVHLAAIRCAATVLPVE